MSDVLDFLRSPEYAELLRDLAEWRRKEAMRAVAELRRRHSDFMKRPVVEVMTPVCDVCWSHEQHIVDSPHRPPDLSAESWRDDLKWCGVAQDDAESIEEGDAVQCHGRQCGGQLLTYGEDKFYVEGVAFEEYFGELVPSSDDAERRKARGWMKRLIYDAYDGRCFACGTVLAWNEMSTDHIQPFSEGGRSEPMNLQLLCRDCNERVKANKIPDEEHFTLHFPLVPVAEGFEGVVW